MTVQAKNHEDLCGKRTRGVTPARIVALALIGLVVLGLAYLRFGLGDGAVPVPDGARPAN